MHRSDSTPSAREYYAYAYHAILADSHGRSEFGSAFAGDSISVNDSLECLEVDLRLSDDLASYGPSWDSVPSLTVPCRGQKRPEFTELGSPASSSLHLQLYQIDSVLNPDKRIVCSALYGPATLNNEGQGEALGCFVIMDVHGIVEKVVYSIVHYD